MNKLVEQYNSCRFTKNVIGTMQRDTSALTAENKELKLKLQAMEQQAHLRDGKRFYHLLPRLTILYLI